MENNLTSTGKISLCNISQKPNYNIILHNHAGEKVGTLDFNTDKLVFTGEAEESAKVFIDFIAKSFAKRLEEERQAEREACAKVCEEMDAGVLVLVPNTRQQNVLAAAIRARGNT